MKKSSKNKKPLKKLAKKLFKKLLVKAAPKAMSAKAKKPQVKAAPKADPKKGKSLPKVNAKAAASKTPAKVDPKAKAVADKNLKKGAAEAPQKNAKAAPVAAVAVVLTKPAKEAKPAKITKAAKIAIAAANMCREATCENQASTKGYCRLDYIKNWKKIKRKEMILKEGKLNNYIEELVGKYPDKYMDVIRQDLHSEVNFTKVIHDLELDESIDDLEYDGDSIDSLIGSIKKEAEDFGSDDEF